MVSIGSIYLALRTGKADTMITAPLEKILGEESDMVQTIKRQLGEANQQSSSAGTMNNGKEPGSDFNLAREGAYLGIAGVVDSLVLPVKLAACLPIAKFMLKRRGR